MNEQQAKEILKQAAAQLLYAHIYLSDDARARYLSYS